jgi:hypothetical protein
MNCSFKNKLFFRLIISAVILNAPILTRAAEVDRERPLHGRHGQVGGALNKNEPKQSRKPVTKLPIFKGQGVSSRLIKKPNTFSKTKRKEKVPSPQLKKVEQKQSRKPVTKLPTSKAQDVSSRPIQKPDAFGKTKSKVELPSPQLKKVEPKQFFKDPPKKPVTTRTTSKAQDVPSRLIKKPNTFAKTKRKEKVPSPQLKKVEPKQFFKDPPKKPITKLPIFKGQGVSSRPIQKPDAFGKTKRKEKVPSPQLKKVEPKQFFKDPPKKLVKKSPVAKRQEVTSLKHKKPCSSHKKERHHGHAHHGKGHHCGKGRHHGKGRHQGPQLRKIEPRQPVKSLSKKPITKLPTSKAQDVPSRLIKKPNTFAKTKRKEKVPSPQLKKVEPKQPVKDPPKKPVTKLATSKAQGVPSRPIQKPDAFAKTKSKPKSGVLSARDIKLLKLRIKPDNCKKGDPLSYEEFLKLQKEGKLTPYQAEELLKYAYHTHNPILFKPSKRVINTDSYVQNMMWIHPEPLKKGPRNHLMGKDDRALQEKVIDPLKDWQKKQPFSTFYFWYDGAMVGDPKAVIQRTKQLLEKSNLNLNNIYFKDIRTLKRVQENPRLFTKQIEIYYRVDALREIISLHNLRDGGFEYTTHIDCDVVGITKEQQFDTPTLHALNHLGYVFGTDSLVTEHSFIMRQKNATCMKYLDEMIDRSFTSAHHKLKAKDPMDNLNDQDFWYYYSEFTDNLGYLYREEHHGELYNPIYGTYYGKASKPMIFPCSQFRAFKGYSSKEIEKLKKVLKGYSR